MWVSSPRCAMLVSAYQSPAVPVNPDHGCAADVPVEHFGSDLTGLYLEEVCRIPSGDVKHLLLGESRCVDGDRVNTSHASSSLTIRCTSCKTDACSAPRDLRPHADSPTRLPDDPTRAEPVRDRSRSRATRYRRRSCRPGTRNRD